MSKLLIQGNYSKIIEESDIEHILALDKHLSFYVQGAEHMPAFRGYVNREGNWVKWDGFRKLLSPNLKFATGLVSRVISFYQKNNKEIEVIDQRPAKIINQPIDISENLKKINKEPYYYQLEILKIIDKNDRGIIKAATGSGKTNIAALITAKLAKKTIIYVVGKDLLYQFHDLFTSIFNQPIGIIGDGKCDIHDINIVSIWTAGNAVGLKGNEILLDSEENEKLISKDKYVKILDLIKSTQLQIIDECHYSACETIQQIYKHSSNAEYFYGLSGTPFRDDGADLLIESILGKYIVDIPASKLIREGYLAKPFIRFRTVPVPELAEEFNNYQSTYKNYVVENEIRNNLILEAAKTLVDKGYQTLVLFTKIKHGKILYELLKGHINCAILDGSNNNDERQKIKDLLAERKLDCIIASKIMDIGVDIPSLSGLVVAGGGKASTRALQRVGRIVRKYPGKKHVVIIDFVDQVKFLMEHSKIRYRAYTSEDGFDVSWPKSLKKPRKKNAKI